MTLMLKNIYITFIKFITLFKLDVSNSRNKKGVHNNDKHEKNYRSNINQIPNIIKVDAQLNDKRYRL